MNIKSTSKRGLLFAVSFVALGTVSAQAFAESTEFRRGYEQGFQDARDGGRQQYGQYQGRNGRIDIETAIYGAQGRRGQTCRAEVALQTAIDRAWTNGNDNRRDNRRDNRWDNRWDDRNSANSRRGFSVVANNQLCGDPSPNRTKTLVVTYRCGNSELTRVQATEGDTLSMRC